MEMTIDELKCIIGEYKLRIPPTVYYELLADLEDAEFIPKADYENRLKADMVAMLIDLKNKLTDISWNIDMYDSDLDFECCYLNDINEVIQEKINALKEDTRDK